MEKNDPIEEARRYVANAEMVIKKANYDPEMNSYSDSKYIKAAGKRDRTLLRYINLGYDTMHLVMGYDGNKERKVCDAGFERAKAIIDYCAKLRPKSVCV